MELLASIIIVMAIALPYLILFYKKVEVWIRLMFIALLQVSFLVLFTTFSGAFKLQVLNSFNLGLEMILVAFISFNVALVILVRLFLYARKMLKR